METQHITPYLLQPNYKIPNNQQLPLLVYQQVFEEKEDLVSQFKDAFERHNWRGVWADSVFTYHHYHSTSHEVLGVAAGSASLILGGPDAQEIDVRAGDMLVLPAGTGHCLESSSADFKVVGAYPEGQANYDICTEEDDPKEKKKNIAQVPLPDTDPITGANRPLLEHWRAS